MSDTAGTTRGMKRKSSDSAGSSDNKKEKLDHNAPMDPTENLFRNDRCIRSILAYLSLEDLANVARASHFFKMNAQVVFETVHGATIEIAYDPGHFAEKQKIFQQFGRLATKVTVSSNFVGGEDADPFDEGGCAVLATIGNFCGNSLNDLTLRGMLINISPNSIGFFAETQVEVRKILGGLSKLSLVSVCVISRFFQYLRSLKELSIHSCCHVDELPQVVTLPQLEILNIGACPIWPLIPGDYFNDFLSANPSIEQVNYHFIVMGDGHLESICSLPNLTHLELYLLFGGNNEMVIMSKMKKLEKLTLHVEPTQRAKFSKLRQMISSDVDLLIDDWQMFQH